MAAFAHLLFWGVVVVALVLYAAWLSWRYFHVERYPDELHFARTEDGWHVALSRYRPREAAATDPVLLFHGLGANRRNLDLTEELSVAAYLADHGYDAWLVEFRGRGFSTRPRLFSRYRYDWCFDEYVEQDIPAAVATVQQVTGARAAHWIGFSTGGLAMLAHLGGSSSPLGVRSAVAIATPARFRRQRGYLAARFVRAARWLRHALVMRLVAPLAGRWHPAPIHIIHNPENLDGRVLRLAMVNVVVNFSRNELLQFSDWLINDQFRSIDHRRDYRADLARVEAPLLLLAGPRDLLAPPDTVKAVHDLVASTDKKLVICSRAQGFSVNYGHSDLLLGRTAPAEIYPLLRDWLDRHGAHEVVRPTGSQPAREGASARLP